jgi:hypothetical protein
MNCKPGDRAIIVRGLPNNLGRIVRVVESIGDIKAGEKYRIAGKSWIHNGTSRCVWVCESFGGVFVSLRRKATTVRPIPDEFLMPLPPESEITKVEERKGITV